MDMSVAKRILNFSRRNRATWSDVESAVDVLANILSRLPVKCLGRFKAVSKLWHGLIRSPSFTKLHFSRSRENACYMLFPFIADIQNLHLIDADGVITETITLPGFEILSPLTLICSYNGLIFFANYPFVPYSYSIISVPEILEIRICNPATSEVRLLPNGSLSEKELGIGVAFGPGNCEYRVFRFFLSNFKHHGASPVCEIFSSSTGTWRGIGCVQHIPMGANHKFFNGKVYWFVALKDDHITPASIFSVDMEDNFKTIELPLEVTANSFLIDLENCLSLVVVHDDEAIMQVWMLKDEDESDWELKCNVEVQYEVSYESIDSVAARENEILFKTTENYHIFNIDKLTWKLLHFEEFFERDFTVFTYAESLLPCR